VLSPPKEGDSDIRPLQKSSYLFDKPMDLLFTRLEVAAVALSVWVLSLIAQDGESHWLEGVQLLALYAMLAVAFYFLPAP